jgi:hypothetical protein
MDHAITLGEVLAAGGFLLGLIIVGMIVMTTLDILADHFRD